MVNEKFGNSESRNPLIRQINEILENLVAIGVKRVSYQLSSMSLAELSELVEELQNQLNRRKTFLGVS